MNKQSLEDSGAKEGQVIALVFLQKNSFQKRHWPCVKDQRTQDSLRKNTTPAAGHWVVASLLAPGTSKCC
ncbi:MAG: hypothetical protein WBP89_19750, partial [Sedimenticolaceae bacterium]